MSLWQNVDYSCGHIDEALDVINELEEVIYGFRNELGQEYIDLKIEICRARDELEKTRNINSNLRSIVENLEIENSRLETKIDDLEKDHRAVVDDLDYRIYQLEQEVRRYA